MTEMSRETLHENTCTSFLLLIVNYSLGKLVITRRTNYWGQSGSWRQHLLRVHWDLWVSTPEGQKLNEEWQSIARCDLKMSTLRTQWADVEALNASDSRFAMWNWCTRKEGVSVESLRSKHASIAESYPEGVGNIGWFTFIPNIGGANAPGRFANIVVFPTMAGLMEHKQWMANGGWRVRQDYYNYVDCQGDYVWTEEVIHRPGE